MSSIKLKAPATLTATPGTGVADLSDPAKIVSLEIESVEINAQHFTQSSSEPNREGFLKLVIAGQTTLVRFSGKKVVEGKFADSLAYLGKGRAHFPVEIELVETDDDVRDALGKGETLLGYLAKSPIGGLSPLIGPATGLIGGVLGFIKSRVEDAPEFSLYGRLPQKITDGDTITITLGDTTKPKAILKLIARVLGAFDQPKKINITLESISLDLNENATIQRKTAPRRVSHRGRRIRNYSESVTLSVKEWLVRSKINQLGLSISAVGHSRTETPPFDPSDTILRLQAWDLLGSVELKQEGGNGRQLLPLSLALTLNSDEAKIEQLKPLIDQSLQVAVAAEVMPKTTAEKITKAAPSVLGFLSKLSIDDLALVDFNGYVLLLPLGAMPPAAASQNRLTATTTNNQVWSARLQKNIEWRGQVIGTLDVALTFSPA